MDPLVSCLWLARAIAGGKVMGEVALLDVRWSPSGASTAERFAAGHIPGAQSIDLDIDLSEIGDLSDGRHPLPSAERFVETLAGVGVGRDTTVIAYDDAGGMIASRVYWMVRHWLGHEKCAVLDGGLDAWLAAGYAIRTGEALAVDGARERLPATVRESAVVSKAELVSLVGERHEHGMHWGDAVGLDARAPERYRGEAEPMDPVAGHIPGARNLPCASLLDGVTKQFRDVSEIRAAFADVGLDGDDMCIASCGSGVTACHLVLAADRAGLRSPRVYVGSWSEWSRDDSLPRSRGVS